MFVPDTRRGIRQLLGIVSVSAWKSLALIGVCLLLAFGGAFWPVHDGLNLAGQWALFILVFCAGLWVTEAMPAFAVSLLAIGLNIAILGRPGGVFAETSHDWERFIAPWGSPLIWLFFGGFVLAAAAERTGLDHWMATRTLVRFGRRPAHVLMGVMGITALLSMFISNTATATLMLAVLGPMFAARSSGDKVAKALLLGIAFAANIGGMGTVIGSPPNAIAAGAIEASAAVNFAQWMVYGIPPAIVLLALAWGYLLVRYLGKQGFVVQEELTFANGDPPVVPPVQQLLVVVTFVATILAWLTSPLHGIPTTVISFIPICTLTATGILGPDDMRRIPWDVLLLIAGGLSLGVAIADTGLATWLVGKLPLDGLSPLFVVLAFAYVTVVLSNLMSNTAAANLIVPLALAAASQANARMVVPVALSASLAMCMPISTPPNAIVYGTRRLTTADLLVGGMLMGAVGPVVVTIWALCVEKFGLI